MTVDGLIELLTHLSSVGWGNAPVFKSKDEEGNGYESVDDAETRDPSDDTYVEMYGWDETIPEERVVVLW